MTFPVTFFSCPKSALEAYFQIWCLRAIAHYEITLHCLSYQCLEFYAFVGLYNSVDSQVCFGNKYINVHCSPHPVSSKADGIHSEIVENLSKGVVFCLIT